MNTSVSHLEEVPVTACPRCGGTLEALADDFGPYLRCYMGCFQQDLLADTPEHLAFLTQVADHQEKQAALDSKRARDHDGQYQKRGYRRNPAWDNFKIGGEDKKRWVKRQA